MDIENSCLKCKSCGIVLKCYYCSDLEAGAGGYISGQARDDHDCALKKHGGFCDTCFKMDNILAVVKFQEDQLNAYEKKLEDFEIKLCSTMKVVDDINRRLARSVGGLCWCGGI